MAATSSGSCPRETTTNNIGWGILTCSTTDHIPFESFRKENTAKSNLQVRPIPRPGFSFSRTIRLDADSPRIHFHATMKNVTGHTVEWSMQSVSQYDTCGPVRGQVRQAGSSDRLGKPRRSLALQPRFPHVHSRESIQQLSQPVPRSLRSGGESCGLGERRRPVCRALCSHGGRTVAGLDGGLACRGRWQQPVRNGRTLPV